MNTEWVRRDDSTQEKSDTAIWQHVLDELRLQLTRNTFDLRPKSTRAQRVDGRWEITCANALAQDWIEHRLGNIIRRELAAATEERVGEIVYRAR